MQNVNPGVRQQAIDHNVEVINYGIEILSQAIKTNGKIRNFSSAHSS